MQQYALIGEKLGHSLSVPIHEAMFERLGLDATYRLVEIPKDEHFRENVIELLKQVDGINITIPYKQDVMPLLTTVAPKAAQIGAVNTVVCRDGFHGYNTDERGFAEMLAYHGIRVADRICYVLGTGGASKAIKVALAEQGAKEVQMVSRHPQGEEISYETLYDAPGGVIVNCTPAGMFPHAEGCPIATHQLEQLMKRSFGVADLIYNPPETNLTRAAKAQGVPACTGLYMLIAQAVEAERLWHPDLSIPRNMTETLMKELKLI